MSAVGPLRFAVLGSPVAHSKSPAMHAAAYRALGLPHTYEKLETTEAELPARLDALRRGDWAGFNVTLPLKARALALADSADARASVIGAANTLVRSADGTIRAYNTDVDALAGELLRLASSGARTLAGTRAIVLGTGGAARAAVAALVDLGFEHVYVRGRSADAFVADLAARTKGAYPISAHALVAPPAEDARVAAVVQATSCGMTGGPPGDVVRDAIHWPSLASDAIALDVVYTPRETPFLAAARARSLAAHDGLGMLARQGARAFELWLGVAPPLDVMLAAISTSERNERGTANSSS
jgi:shikimate dehydrogenase